MSPVGLGRRLRSEPATTTSPSGSMVLNNRTVAVRLTHLLRV